MARSATTSDVFNAVGDAQRREIINLLGQGELSVNDIVAALGLRQPQVSKHLRVLKEVGLVSVREAGQQRLYRLNAQGLKPIHDWVAKFEQLWNERLDRLAEYLRVLQAEESQNQESQNQESQNQETKEIES
ncbi:MAG: ArsR/SmtB family transcription factor [Candidatus Sericytochromatia bacterium]